MTAPPFLPLRTVPLGNVYHRWQSVCTERHVGGTHLVNYRRPIATRTPLDHAGGIRSIARRCQTSRHWQQKHSACAPLLPSARYNPTALAVRDLVQSGFNEVALRAVRLSGSRDLTEASRFPNRLKSGFKVVGG
jgi:hypothetical protein